MDSIRDDSKENLNNGEISETEDKMMNEIETSNKKDDQKLKKTTEDDELDNSIKKLDEIENEASKILSEKDEESKKSQPNDSVTWKDAEKEEDKHEEDKQEDTEDRKNTPEPKVHPGSNKVHNIRDSSHKRSDFGSHDPIIFEESLDNVLGQEVKQHSKDQESMNFSVIKLLNIKDNLNFTTTFIDDLVPEMESKDLLNW